MQVGELHNAQPVLVRRKLVRLDFYEGQPWVKRAVNSGRDYAEGCGERRGERPCRARPAREPESEKAAGRGYNHEYHESPHDEYEPQPARPVCEEAQLRPAREQIRAAGSKRRRGRRCAERYPQRARSGVQAALLEYPYIDVYDYGGEQRRAEPPEGPAL